MGSFTKQRVAIIGRYLEEYLLPLHLRHLGFCPDHSANLRRLQMGRLDMSANGCTTLEQFHQAKQTLQLVLEKRAASVLGQMNGTIPATWEAQKAQPQKLVNCDDINLQELGGI